MTANVCQGGDGGGIYFDTGSTGSTLKDDVNIKYNVAEGKSENQDGARGAPRAGPDARGDAEVFVLVFTC